MVTIYYPYFDLESRGLIPPVDDHLLNIKLLLLIADRVLILTSHLLDIPTKKLIEILDELHDYVAEGKLVFPLYEGQTKIDDYLEQKIGKAEGTIRYEKYYVSSNLLKTQLFDVNPQIINVNNADERQRFQMIYSEMNLEKAREANKPSLIEYSTVFQEELFSAKEKRNSYLTLFEVNELLDNLIKSGKISRRSLNFFIRNQISSYYYCGSIAHSAIVAYNPYFEMINFADTTKDISFHTTEVYSPGFLLNILIGLKVIDNAEDIKNLSKESINDIRKDKAWAEFQNVFEELNRNTQSLDLILYKEQSKEKKLDRVKKFAFFFETAITSTAISLVIDQLMAGFVMVAVTTIVNFATSIVNDSKYIKHFKISTSDEIINRIYATREPFAVITDRIRNAVEQTVL